MAPLIGPSHLLLLLSSLLVLASYQLMTSEAIVVDGTRKGPSARVNQSREQEMIDVFNTKTCGISDPDEYKSGFVNAAKPGEFPWLASLQLWSACARRNSKPDKHSACMGAFISDTWVLSAAHCFAIINLQKCLRWGETRIVAGSTNHRSPDAAAFKIKRVFVHGDYDDERKVGFDVALIELASPAKLRQSYDHKEPFINTVCLPIEGKEFKEGQAVKIAGWGSTEWDNEKSMSDYLLTTDLYLTNTTKCIKRYVGREIGDRNKAIRKQFDKYNDVLCAHYHGTRDACQGDSGSPMLEYADNKAVAIGIVSFGVGCAEKRFPGIYERVSSMMPWIKDITQNKEKAKVKHTVYTNDYL